MGVLIDVLSLTPEAFFFDTINVSEALNAKEGEFTVRQIEFECPGVSRETIKAVLKKNSGCFVCTGHGVSARWRRIKKIEQMP